MAATERNGNSMGFSLVEILVSITVSTILLGILFTVCIRVENLTGRISEDLEKRTSLRMAPLLLSRWIKEAGMNLNVPGDEYLQAAGSEVRVKSDRTGNDGLPDGDTEDSFEDIRIRTINNELKIRSGNGTYQPFLRGISTLSASRQGRELLSLELESGENRAGAGQTYRIKAMLRLWNDRPNLFPKEIK